MKIVVFVFSTQFQMFIDLYKKNRNLYIVDIFCIGRTWKNQLIWTCQIHVDNKYNFHIRVFVSSHFG